MPTCHDCIHAVRDTRSPMMSAPLCWWTPVFCANHPDTPGRFRPVPAGPPCRNFRPKPQGPNRIEPPAPTDPTVCHIALTKGLFTIVDAADFERLSRHRWHATGTKGRFYAATVIDGKSVAMHRMLMSPPDGMLVDHIDGNGLNNRQSNLRLATRSQNRRNTRPQNASSRFLGVVRRGDKYLAKITHAGRTEHLGTFEDEKEAARTRDRRARELFGDFAWLNFPDASP